jgi:hypothetical protein
MTSYQRVTINLPAGEFTSEREEDIALSLQATVKELAWGYVKREYGVAATLNRDSFFFTVPAGFQAEGVKDSCLNVVKRYWSIELPEPTGDVREIDAEGYLI